MIFSMPILHAISNYLLQHLFFFFLKTGCPPNSNLPVSKFEDTQSQNKKGSLIHNLKIGPWERADHRSSHPIEWISQRNS